MALEANGFAQFKLKKHGKEWEIGEIIYIATPSVLIVPVNTLFL